MATLPIIITFVVKSSRNKKLSYHYGIYEKIFGFLFVEYKNKYLYWEILKLVIIKYFTILLAEFT
jgi:hypothetical protein